MKRRRSAYEIPVTRVQLSPEEQRRAIAWWQAGEVFHPLCCPVCGLKLRLAAKEVRLECATAWCSYESGEIPWGVYAGWLQEGKP